MKALMILAATLTACAAQPEKLLAPPKDPNAIQQPSLEACNEIVANNGAVITVAMDDVIVMVSGKYVYLIDKSANITSPTAKTLDLGPYCTLTLSYGRIIAISVHDEQRP